VPRPAPDRPPLPAFLIIGAQKSATRWLRTNLGEHPEISVAPTEVKYFNHPKRMDALGTDWYRRQFTAWAGEPLTGESTPGYMIWRHRPAEVAARIKATIPNVRLLAVLRNPIDRANSALIHNIKQQRIHPRTRLVDHVRSVPADDDWMCIVSGGWYAASLESYFEVFGQQLQVLLYDDVRTDPRGAFDRARRHVGATEEFFPDGLVDVVASNRTDAPDDVTAEEREEMFEHFRADIEKLERLLARDLSHWRPLLSSGLRSS
jgi:Sulfotransferase domain